MPACVAVLTIYVRTKFLAPAQNPTFYSTSTFITLANPIYGTIALNHVSTTKLFFLLCIYAKFEIALLVRPLKFSYSYINSWLTSHL